jgi:hypothetical protein
VRTTATPEETFAEDSCLKFKDDQLGSWNAPKIEALKASDVKALEAYQCKKINVPVHCDSECLYSDDQTLTTVPSYSSTKSAGNVIRNN